MFSPVWVECFLPLTYFHPADPFSTAVGPVLNATTACQEIISIFKHSDPCFVSKLLPEFFVISKKHPCFLTSSETQTLRRYCFKLTDWILPIWKFRFSGTNIKILLGKFQRSVSVLVNGIYWIINSDKFSRSDDGLYFGVFLGHG